MDTVWWPHGLFLLHCPSHGLDSTISPIQIEIKAIWNLSKPLPINRQQSDVGSSTQSIA